MSDLIIKKNGADYKLPMLAEHYPADRVYLDGDVNKTVQDEWTKITKIISNQNINSAWGSLYEGTVDIDTSEDYRGKNIQISFVSDDGYVAIPVISRVLSNQIKVSLFRATTSAVSGKIYILINNY